MIFLSGGGLNLLTPEPGLVVWTVVTFLVVLAVLWLFAWKPIISQLDKRNERVETDLDESRQQREKAEQLLSEIERRLSDAHKEAGDILSDAKARADKIKSEMMKDASDEARKIKENAEKEIENARLKAIDSIKESAVDLTSEIIARLFQNQFAESEHKELIKKEIENIKH